MRGLHSGSFECDHEWSDSVKEKLFFFLTRCATDNKCLNFFYVLLTVHLSIIFILVTNQLDAQNLFYNKFISCLYMFRAPCAYRQEVKIVLYNFWYHHACRWPSRALDGHL